MLQNLTVLIYLIRNVFTYLITVYSINLLNNVFTYLITECTMFTYLITEEKAYGITVTVINKVINKIKHVGRICLISWKFNKSNYFHILMLLKVFKNCTFSFSFLNQTFKPTPSFSSSNSSSENPWFCFNLELAPKTFNTSSEILQ